MLFALASGAFAADGISYYSMQAHLTANLLYIAAVLIAKRGVSEQVLHSLKAFGLEHRGARRAHAFHVHEWGVEIQRQVNSVYSLAEL